VVAGIDCGFANFAILHTVDPDIAWHKLQVLVCGAEIASCRLLKQRPAVRQFR
jgi:5-methyltetrahydropteroyltriglutamate--homocysteine methyltransferase